LNKDEEIAHHELIANCFFLFIAGEETTAGLIELGLLHLIQQSKLNQDLNDTKLRTTCTDELLRYDSPAQIVVRIASENCQIHGHAFSSGDAITICLGSANRDPLKFERADELMLSRTPNHHLAFASGIHRCLGDWLAKKEFELLLKSMIKRYRHFSILDEPIWKENLNMRSLSSLHLSIN
jgi:cytochrome P450